MYFFTHYKVKKGDLMWPSQWPTIEIQYQYKTKKYSVLDSIQTVSLSKSHKITRCFLTSFCPLILTQIFIKNIVSLYVMEWLCVFIKLSLLLIKLQPWLSFWGKKYFMYFSPHPTINSNYSFVQCSCCYQDLKYRFIPIK